MLPGKPGENETLAASEETQLPAGQCQADKTHAGTEDTEDTGHRSLVDRPWRVPRAASNL